MSWPHPYITLDQNYLRRPDKVAGVLDDCCRNGLNLLLPDGAFHEFAKSGRFLDTARQSLQRLAPYRELIFSADRLSALMAHELEQRSPAALLVNRDTTVYLRSILAELERSEEAALKRLADGPIATMMPASLEVWNNHEENRRQVRVLHDLLKAGLESKQLRALRQSPSHGIEKWLCSQSGMAIVFQGMKRRGADEATAYCLTCSPSVTAGFFSGLAGVAIYWIGAGGIESARLNTFSGDLNDLEYVVLGALTCRLATDDKRAAAVCNAVRAAYQARMLLPRPA